VTFALRPTVQTLKDIVNANINFSGNNTWTGTNDFSANTVTLGAASLTGTLTHASGNMSLVATAGNIVFSPVNVPRAQFDTNGLLVYSGSDPANAQTISVRSVAAVGHQFVGEKTGTGATNLPFFFIGATSGSPAFAIVPAASGANYVSVAAAPTAHNPNIQFVGADTNVTGWVQAQGTGSINFSTQLGAALQAQVVNTTGATRFLTLTGSVAGNPTIGVSGGGLTITPALTAAGGITVVGGVAVTTGSLSVSDGGITTSANGGLSLVDTGVNGVNITLNGDTGGPNKPKKYIRSQNGSLQFLNDAYGVMGVWDDNNHLRVDGNFAANSVTPAAQPTGYGTPTGGARQASFAAGSIALPDLAAAVAQLIIDLKGTGLIGA